MNDCDGIAITMALGNVLQAVAMEHQREYAERYNWIVKEFTDLAFTFVTSFLYYLDYDSIIERVGSNKTDYWKIINE